jgi:EAL domain-containing protein (putative c-di-GMP-specific phosphodiesterase class I)
MANLQSVLEVLAELRRLGVRLAIDDFGTGYSSLSYLRQFPLDRLKIDQSFVHDVQKIPANLAIVKTIISLAANLGMEVVAEGVESEDELALLQANHCLEVQGYHFSKPVPAADFLHWYQTRKSERGIVLSAGGSSPAEEEATRHEHES